MIRRPPRSTLDRSSAASDVYKRQQMANLDLINGVSFTKGCYPGQEIVARMHYLGKLKQRMYLAAAPDDELPQPGDKLYGPDTGEQATGMIVNAARGPDGRPASLAGIHNHRYQHGDARRQRPTGIRHECTAPNACAPAWRGES